MHGRRLSTATTGSKTLSFTYNESGIRTSKTINNQVKHEYVVDGTKIISDSWIDAANVHHLVTYIYDAKGVIGMAYRNDSMSAGVFEYYIFEKNLQGDIVAVYTASGTKLVSYTYDAWGNVSSLYHNNGASTAVRYNNFRYRGYFYDEDTGLYYLNSRYYDPATGRFLNPDIYVNANGDLTGFNMYAYCSGNPVVYADYTGEDAIYLTDTDGAYGCGHTGLLIQNDKGVWYHFYWGNKKVELVELKNFSFTTFTALNNYLATEGIYGSVLDARGKRVKVNAYESYYYYKGDYSKSLEYAKSLQAKYKSMSRDENFYYNLLFNNCMQVSNRVLNKTKTHKFLNSDTIKEHARLIFYSGTFLDRIIPNFALQHTYGEVR